MSRRSVWLGKERKSKEKFGKYRKQRKSWECKGNSRKGIPISHEVLCLDCLFDEKTQRQ